MDKTVQEDHVYVVIKLDVHAVPTVTVTTAVAICRIVVWVATVRNDAPVESVLYVKGVVQMAVKEDLATAV